jgi:DNA (cytosine-5)-methyltransferase 1
MAKVYKENHRPKLFYECPISDLLTKELPEELYNLDILDGSPPCSTFSMAGSREKQWKKDKKFREGQSKQILSDLFFEWIALVERLQPKVAIAENVKGMLIGNAKLYTKQVVEELNRIGYSTQVFLLNGASMGLPQKRERVFFIANKSDKRLRMEFSERPITFGEIYTQDDSKSARISPGDKRLWHLRKKGDKTLGDINERETGSISRFSLKLIYRDRVPQTITASDSNILFDELRNMNSTELKLASSFPLDYNFLDNKVEYIVGMSVPPVMMAQVSYQVYKQLLS